MSASDTAVATRDARAFKTISKLAQAYFTNSDANTKLALRREIAELAAAIANNHRPVVPRYVDFIEAPFLLTKALNNPIGRGATPAANASDDDDPPNSSFWRKPTNITNLNLALGFARANIPDYTATIWNYAAAKKGGRNGGCELRNGDQHIKAKFAEVHSEPFTARIFHALGYNVLPTDYAPALRIRYDRRFFTEFNHRRLMTMTTGMFFIPMYRAEIQSALDPFKYIDHAVTKTGATLDSSALRTFLLKSPKRGPSANNFNSAAEEQIDYLVTVPANVQTEPPHSHSIGPWDFGELDHENLRELRGAGLLAAWLGWWDSRFENTRIRISEHDRQIELKHYFTDLGGGLGASGGTFHHTCERIEDFPESFTKSGRKSRPLRIINYEPIAKTRAFREMTIDDARWMAGLIAQLSSEQITVALQASGFSPNEADAYTQKLLTRRAKMLQDFSRSRAVQNTSGTPSSRMRN